MSRFLIHLGDCIEYLESRDTSSCGIDLTFLDPPFNQGKEYREHDDRMDEEEYWSWMRRVCELVYDHSSRGAAIYFMQREKNTESVMRVLREAGWNFQNLIVWKKMTSAIPSQVRFGKAYQVIAYAVKEPRARAFNRLRIDPPLPKGYYPRENGIFVTDVWDDIRELTSGYFARDEALFEDDGTRTHKQQSPVALLLRIILSSSGVGDCVFDPFAGTGTTLSVASQTGRRGIGVEKDYVNFGRIENRLAQFRTADSVEQYRDYYRFTVGLNAIWPYVKSWSVDPVEQVVPQHLLLDRQSGQ